MNAESLLKTPKVSVVVPVYNVEKYLSECLDSIVSQTLEDIEIIVVNDGSPDNSSEIIKKYAERDSRIKVINKENGGYASAVNKGISVATGEYIAEVDSDDYIDRNMYKRLYEIAQKENVDIVVGRYAEFIGKDVTFRMFPKTFVPKDYSNTKLNVKEIYKENKLELLGFTAIWSAIYKRDLVVKNKIRLNENVKCYNDNGFWFRTRSVAETLYYTDEIMYFYRVDVAGQTIRKMNERYPILIDEFLDIRKQYQTMGIWKENSNFWFRHFINNIIFFVMPKIDVQTMAPFAEAVKPIIESFLRDEELLPDTLDKYRKDLMDTLLKKGTEKFVSAYLKSKYKVSVVMAVYNGARFISSTIPQVLNQTFNDIELILVNDGSTDESLKLMQTYQYDFRVKIINLEENRGQSYARNIGLRNAVGQYVIFLDCDDDFNPELIGKLHWCMNKYKLDVCMTGYTVHNCRTDHEYSNLFSSLPDKVFVGKELTSKEFSQIIGWNWDKMYRKEFLTKNQIFFPEDMHISEDALVAYPAMLLAQRAYVVKESLITYKEFGSNSVSSKMDKHIADNFQYYDRLHDFIVKHNLGNTHEKHFINLFVGHSIFAFENLLKTETARSDFFDLLVDTYIEKFNISNDMPEYYFDDDKIFERYKKLRRMMKYKKGEYALYVADLKKIPLEIDALHYEYDSNRKNIVVIKQVESSNCGKWIFAFEHREKSANNDWVNVGRIFVLNNKNQDSYVSLSVTLLKNNSFFIRENLHIAVTALSEEYVVNLFKWEKKNKISNLIGYVLKNGVLELYARFSGGYDGISMEVNMAESRNNELPVVNFLEKRFLGPKDLVAKPIDLKLSIGARKITKKRRKYISVIRFLLKRTNRHKIWNKIYRFIKE